MDRRMRIEGQNGSLAQIHSRVNVGSQKLELFCREQLPAVAIVMAR